MQCARCQHENPAGATFCDECGARLEAACSACGDANRAGAKFCRKCGEALTPPAASGAAASAKFASPEAYTPRHLAERILTSRAALKGERKQVTVLFADLKGSMELLADRDPEEARKILDPVVELMMEAVHRYEGTVNQVMGDGIMALFGAPLAHEDHAVRACHAALRMQDSVKHCAEAVQRTLGVPIHIRVGLNSGEVVVGSIGSDLRMDYTAVGQTTHLAARMEQMALPGSILMTPATLRLVEGAVQVEPLGLVPVKGLAKPIEVYEITSAAPVRTRLEAAASRGLTRFVGRGAEIAQLRLGLEHARAGRGQVAAIVGEPGVGKSRLVWELTHRDPPVEWLVLEAGASSYGKATSYLAVTTLLRSYFNLGERDTYEDMRGRIGARLSALGESPWPAAPAIEALLGVPVEDAPWQGLEPRQRRQHTLEVVRRLMLRESQIQPLLLIVEDLHWIDAETQAWLDGLVDGLAAARLLLLVTYRPEYQHAWGNRTYYTQIRVDPLPREGAEALLQSLLGADVELASLRSFLIERTGSNPFFLEESVRTLVETNALVGGRGAYRLAQAVDTVQVPATVQAILASRIDRLPLGEKLLLQSAAVIGKDVPFNLLHAVADEAEESLRRQLAHLQSAEFLYETRLLPESEYTFKHALTQEVAYGGLLTDRRRVVHARIVEEIERLHGDRLVEHVDRLAHHALRGQVWGKAREYLRRAGLSALGRSANREAAAFFEQALAVITHLPETREVQDEVVDLCLDLRNALTLLGEPQRTLEHLRRAEAVAERVDDQRRLGRVLSFEANCLFLLGQHESAIDAGRRALGIAAALDDAALRTATEQYVGRAHQALGNYRRAIEIFGDIVRSLTGDLARSHFGLPVIPAVFSRSHLAMCLAEVGAFDEATRHAQDATQIADETGHPDTLLWAHRGSGLVHLARGEGASAARALERALTLCQVYNMPTYIARISSELALARAMCGHATEALALGDQALENAQATKQAANLSGIALRRGEVYLLLSRLPEAEASAARALALFRGQRERGNEAHALRLLADVRWRGDPPDTSGAAQAYHESMALAQELGMQPLVARCHLGLGLLQGQRGETPSAHDSLAAAAAGFRKMAMTAWLGQAEAVRARLL